jgi:dihydrofolate reductase
MRKLKLQVQLSVDGFVAGPNGEMDWMTWNMDDGLKKYINDLTDSVDCILLGRKMTGGFVQYWESVVQEPGNPEYEFGKKMCDTHKVVFSKTLEKSEWENTDLAKGDISAEVNRLKNQPGKGIIAYGGAGFVSSLIRHDLIDEYHFFINPAIIGSGMSIYKNIEKRMNLDLVKATAFECGIVVLHYQPARA